MTEVASRELRNRTREILEMVEAGEAVTITVGGRPVAVLQPASRRSRWVTRAEFSRTILSHLADPGLRDDLRRIAPDTTDDLRDR